MGSCPSKDVAVQMNKLYQEFSKSASTKNLDKTDRSKLRATLRSIKGQFPSSSGDARSALSISSSLVTPVPSNDRPEAYAPSVPGKF